MPYYESSGVRLYYEDDGAGPAVVFAHEFAGDIESWRPQVESLQGTYRVVRANARGYPPSDVPADPAQYSQSIAAADILALLDHLGLQAAHLVGLSMGGFAVLHAALQSPSRVTSLVVAGCGYGSPPWERQAFRWQMEALADGLEWDGIGAFAERYASGDSRRTFQRKRPGDWEAFRSRLAEHSATGTIHTLRKVLAARPSLWDFSTTLSELLVPTLLVAGDRDIPSLEATFYLHRVLPTARLCVLPGCGHTINLEEPELFNCILSAFLVAPDSGGAND